jgi:hypothetical protein
MGEAVLICCDSGPAVGRRVLEESGRAACERNAASLRKCEEPPTREEDGPQDRRPGCAAGLCLKRTGPEPLFAISQQAFMLHQRFRSRRAAGRRTQAVLRGGESGRSARKNWAALRCPDKCHRGRGWPTGVGWSWCVLPALYCLARVHQTWHRRLSPAVARSMCAGERALAASVAPWACANGSGRVAWPWPPVCPLCRPAPSVLRVLRVRTRHPWRDGVFASRRRRSRSVRLT